MLQSGLTPGKLAMTLCLGVTIGILPLPWGATCLCVLCGQLFRLNHALLQTVNYLVYPAQLALLVPFCLLGDRLCPWGPSCDPELIAALFRNPLDSLQLLARIMTKGMLAWSVTAVPLAVLLYLPLVRLLSKRSPCSGSAG